MKKLLLSLTAVFVATIVLAQQPETVLQPSRIIAYPVGPEDSVDPPIKYSFDYNDNGTLAGFTVYELDKTQISRIDTVNFQYNNQNDIVRCTWKKIHPPEWLHPEMTERHDYTYNDKNQLEEVCTTYLTQPDTISRWTPVYDEENRVVTDTFYNRSYWNWFETPRLRQIRNRFYDESGNVTIIEEYDKNGITKKIRRTETLMSDGKVQSIKREQCDGNSNVFVNKRLEHCIYSDNYLSVVEVDGFNNENQWYHSKRIVYTRDTNGHIVLAEYQLWDGNAYADNKRTVYELNEYGYPTTMEFQKYSSEDNAWLPGSSISVHKWEGGVYCNYNHDIPNLAYNAVGRILDSVFTQQHLRFIDKHCFSYSQGRGLRRVEISYVETPNPHYAVDEQNELKVGFHPNPTSGFVTITGENLADVEVVDIMGRTVMKSYCDGDKVKIDLSQQPAGVYLFKIADKNGEKCTKKAVKK